MKQASLAVGFAVLLLTPRTFGLRDVILNLAPRRWFLKLNWCLFQSFAQPCWVQHLFAKVLCVCVCVYVLSHSELTFPFLIPLCLMWSVFLCQAFKLIVSCFSESVPYPPLRPPSTHSYPHPLPSTWVFVSWPALGHPLRALELISK